MVTLPMVLLPEPGHPDSVSVYGHGVADGQPVLFLIDTGAASSSVPWGVGQPWEAMRESRGASSAQVPGGRVLVGHLECGPFHVTDLICDQAEQGPPILGLDVLGTGPMSIRLADGLIEANVPEPQGTRLPLGVAPDGRPHWYVDVLLSGTVQARAILDTGASLTVVDRAFVHANPDLVELTGRTDDGTDAAGVSIVAERATLGPCRIGGVDFEASAAVIVDLAGMNAHLAWPIDLIIGVPLLLRGYWHVDPPRALWSVTAVG